MPWPSGTATKLSIVDNVISTLQGIVAGATYKSTVEQVVLASATQKDINVYPAIVVTPPRASYADSRLDLIQGTLTFPVVVFVRNQRAATPTGELMPDTVIELVEDVRIALLADVTRGGYARDTHLTMDDPFPTVVEPIWGAELTVSIDYAHARTDPTAAF